MFTTFDNMGRSMKRGSMPGLISTDLFSRMSRKLAFLHPVDSATGPPPLVICRVRFWCKASSASLPGTPWADSFRERPSERFLGSFPGTVQEYSRRHWDRNCVLSDRAAETARDPDFAKLILDNANDMPDKYSRAENFISYLFHY